MSTIWRDVEIAKEHRDDIIKEHVDSLKVTLRHADTDCDDQILDIISECRAMQEEIDDANEVYKDIYAEWRRHMVIRDGKKVEVYFDSRDVDCTMLGHALFEAGVTPMGILGVSATFLPERACKAAGVANFSIEYRYLTDDDKLHTVYVQPWRRDND